MEGASLKQLGMDRRHFDFAALRCHGRSGKVGLAEKYNRVAGKVSGLGLVRKEDATLEQYLTGKSLDGLYFMIGEQEKKFRQNPAETGSAILGKVFGALQ